MESDLSWMVPIEVMLGSLNHGEVQACSISSVPDEIRDPNDDAYKPKLVSIGPLHRGTTRHLQLMEEPKWHYMREFLDRKGSQEQTRRSELRLRDCGMEILKMDKVIRASYGGNIELEPHEFAKIMIVDGCFLLELLIRLGSYMENKTNSTYSEDPILETEEKVFSVLNDITMLENQIPFIVLKKLYRKVFPNGTEIKDDHRVADIVRKAFGYPLMNSSGGAHILHLMHLSTIEQNQHGSKEVKKASKELVRCAARLKATGIMIQPGNNSSNLDNKLVDVFNFDINFNGKVLEIPVLHIKETTEVKWRNLIAWEQSRIWIRCKYTSYALFFQGLICCKHDIELLEENGVIVNESKKSKEDLLTLFRTICEGVEHMDSSYSELCVSLNEYKRAKPWRKWPIVTWHLCRVIFEIVVYYWKNWFTILIRDHVPTVWKLIGVLAAIVLLALTIAQTYYSAHSSH
ncbi:UPF0481 protein At3g47200-like [Gastrolobium bilobum]|uniref:UPF0481 protein At3g47200-like n=1 Tax=Gastrolobium bilobum TaxID=150636 RepID=UPI002AB2B01F|nr:UPF0481 protein At3g47200-like [Gastrolobium bilobum]